MAPHHTTKKQAKMPRNRTLTMLCVLLVSASTHASDEFGLDGEDYLSELPVVLTVTRLPQSREDLPASVTVIDRQMIEASGAKEIPELLRLVAGFEVGHSNLIGPRATVTYHGMSDDFARRMQVLVDGRSIYTPATGGIDWYGLPLLLEDIERIEVTRGPNGVTYGANAFLGVINILTYHPSEVRGTTVKAIGGDNGYRRGMLRHAASQGALDYRFSMEYQGDDGNAYYRDELPDSLRDDKSIKGATLRADYRSGINDYLTFQLGLSDNTLGDGVVGDVTQPPHTNEGEQRYAQFKWKRIFSTDNDIELQFYHNYNSTDADYFIPNLSVIFGIPASDPGTPGVADSVEELFGHTDDPVYVPHSHTMQRNDVEFIHRSKPFEQLRLVWGAEARLDTVSSPGLTGVNSPVENRLYRLFANGEWSPADRWLVNTGVMVENNEITDTNISPRVALNYRLAPRHSLRVAYSVNYRTPAVLEEDADYGARFYTDDQIIDQIWKSDGDLEAEKSSSVELGLVGTTKDRALEYDLRLFHDHIENLIAAPIDRAFVEPYSALCGLYGPFCRATVLVNDGSVKIKGVELQAKLRAGKDTMLSLGYSQVSARGEILDRLNPTSYLNLDGLVPKTTLSMLVDHTFPGKWQVSLGHYRVSTMSFMGGDETGGVKTTDVRLAKHLELDGAKAKLALVVQDINGTYYEFSESIPRTRSVYLNAELTF